MLSGEFRRIVGFQEDRPSKPHGPTGCPQLGERQSREALDGPSAIHEHAEILSNSSDH
jgi:hypothetical protein